MGNLKTIHQVAQAFQQLNFNQVVRESFEETKNNITSYDRQNISDGFLIDGNPIRPELQSIAYAAKKKNTGGLAAFGTPDLKLTGAFQRGIGTIINSKSFTTFSVDEKATKLELKYSKLIYGLPDKFKANYVQVIGPVIFKKIKAITGL